MNYLDLFHGIGGFALGAYLAGLKFKNHFCSDIEKYAIDLYKLRFPDSIQLGDITKIDFEKLKKDFSGEWIITGGFPCQDISVAGKGRGLIDEKTGEKTRSGLWFDYWRAIRVLRPKFAIIENIGALVRRGLATVLENLTEIGYNAEWQDIRAEDMGAPHRRERIWIICYTNTNSINEKQQERRIQSKSKKFIRSNTRNVCREVPNTMQYGRKKQKWNIKTKNAYKQKCNWWKVEPSVGRVVNGVSNRVDRLKELGNAIVPQIAELLFNQIKKYL